MLPRVLLFSAVVIWGWTFVATKILVAEIGPVEIFGLRLAIGLPFLGVVLLAKRVPLRFTRVDAGPLALGGAIFTLHFLVQIAGLVTTTATNTGWIISVSPLVLALFSVLFLRERIGWRGGLHMARHLEPVAARPCAVRHRPSATEGEGSRVQEGPRPRPRQPDRRRDVRADPDVPCADLGGDARLLRGAAGGSHRSVWSGRRIHR
jgi:hypothetical protein